jgi:hypothetical protein
MQSRGLLIQVHYCRIVSSLSWLVQFRLHRDAMIRPNGNPLFRKFSPVILTMSPILKFFDSLVGIYSLRAIDSKKHQCSVLLCAIVLCTSHLLMKTLQVKIRVLLDQAANGLVLYFRCHLDLMTRMKADGYWVSSPHLPTGVNSLSYLHNRSIFTKAVQFVVNHDTGPWRMTYPSFTSVLEICLEAPRSIRVIVAQWLWHQR